MSDEPDYTDITVPSEKLPEHYSYIERRTEIFGMIEEAGHPRNLRRNQNQLAERYGVTQQQISKDIKRLREYQRNKSGSRAISTSRWLGEKVVTQNIQSAQALEETAETLEDRGEIKAASNIRQQAADLWDAAMDNQMEYNDFLFKLGQLDEAPQELNVSGDAGEVYMEMLRQQAEDKAEDEE